MTDLDRPIAADWLALRRTADTAARDLAGGLVDRCAAELTQREGPVTVIDIGAGTGANQAYLQSRLGLPSRWVLLDHDATLLGAASGGDRRVVGGIEQVDALVSSVTGPCLVTCSALLDLLTAPQLDGLGAVLARRRVPGLFSLTVDGRVGFDPGHDDDHAVTAAFNEHQARSGRPGPAAAAPQRARWPAHRQPTGPACTAWLQGSGPEPLVTRLLTERVSAALEQRPDLAARCRAWLALRLEQAASGALGVTVGHTDLLVLP